MHRGYLKDALHCTALGSTACCSRSSHGILMFRTCPTPQTIKKVRVAAHAAQRRAQHACTTLPFSKKRQCLCLCRHGHNALRDPDHTTARLREAAAPREPITARRHPSSYCGAWPRTAQTSARHSSGQARMGVVAISIALQRRNAATSRQDFACSRRQERRHRRAMQRVSERPRSGLRSAAKQSSSTSTAQSAQHSEHSAAVCNTPARWHCTYRTSAAPASLCWTATPTHARDGERKRTVMHCTAQRCAAQHSTACHSTSMSTTEWISTNQGCSTVLERAHLLLPNEEAPTMASRLPKCTNDIHAREGARSTAHHHGA